MALSPDLWNSLVPPDVWLTVASLERAEADHVNLTLRVKEAGKRSVSATVPVSRYAPTASVVLAASKCLGALEVAQVAVTRTQLADQLHVAVRDWVDPF